MNRILKLFCNPKDSREFCKKPYSSGDYTYATDGAIIIRVPRLKGVQEIKDPPKNIDNLYVDEPTEWHDIPKVKKKTMKCFNCDGKGRNFTCPECNGSGDVNLYNTYSEYTGIECNSCDGTGIIGVCDSCGGTGRIPVNSFEHIVDVPFDHNRLAKCNHLKNCKIGITKGEKHYLKFDGGDGLIMQVITY